MTFLAARTDGHGPEWARAVADLADKAGAVFARAGTVGCLSVIDLEPWRRPDAWWLRQQLEPLARLAGRPVRYVPCTGLGDQVSELKFAPTAPAWSAGAVPVQLRWTEDGDQPHCRETAKAWTPDGPVLILAGDVARRLTQDLLLAHHGTIQEWGGEAGARQWQPLAPQRFDAWITESLDPYVKGLPSSMFSVPTSYWRFLEKASAWAEHGMIVLARAEGWSSLAEIREDAAQQASVSAESPPVNFHWLARQVPGLGASACSVRACRGDAVQLIAGGLPDDSAMLAALGKPLAAAAQAGRADRARAVRLLAAGNSPEAALAVLAVLQSSPGDPALLRATWDALVAVALAAAPPARAGIAAWLEQAVSASPWIIDDADLLRAAGHLALACGRLDLAQNALRTLVSRGRATPDDHAALAHGFELCSQFEAGLAACGRALSRQPDHAQALAVRERIAARMAAMQAPWSVRHGPDPINSSSQLLLDPLHASHATMLHRQMRDPSIASMTALPALAQGDDGTAWIQARLDDGPASFAIVHRQVGLVGYLDLRIWETTAFVCYWIGPDFQGRGLCAPALDLACELAFRSGIDLLLSSAYDDNVRSLRVLRKRGFSDLGLRAVPPDADRTFVMLPARPMDEALACERLIAFCEHTKSGLRFSAQPCEPERNQEERP